MTTPAIIVLGHSQNRSKLILENNPCQLNMWTDYGTCSGTLGSTVDNANAYRYLVEFTSADDIRKTTAPLKYRKAPFDDFMNPKQSSGSFRGLDPVSQRRIFVAYTGDLTVEEKNEYLKKQGVKEGAVEFI